MGEQANAMARSCGYYTTGTCEFLVDNNLDFYFLEMNTRLQVEHPITEEITGIDLVEEMITIAAGHPLKYKQDDIKINGHATELRVYAEDPSRKFLPSIGFLRKYQEPDAHEHIRIDTGVEEGSEISMYYDPMISKLVSWGEDRQTSMDLLEVAIDQYVVQGVADNLGFGKSILNNPDYKSGNYDTAFIEKWYPEGYAGETLTADDESLLALTAAKIKNLKSAQNAPVGSQGAFTTTFYSKQGENVYRVDIKGDDYTVTNHTTGDSQTVNVNKFGFEKNTLIKIGHNDSHSTFQLLSASEMDYTFQYEGATREMRLFTAEEFEANKYMAPPKVIDYGSMIQSPMPGKIISVSVAPGDEVQDGQEICTIEAMKMQNLIKSERSGVIKTVSVEAGASVDVDEVLIEFE